MTDFCWIFIRLFNRMLFSWRTSKKQMLVERSFKFDVLGILSHRVSNCYFL